MPLLCELGWHDAIPAARWNEGFYFTKCRRCRQDLVRTAYEGWHVPNGFRVVWQGRPPGERLSARLVAEPELPLASPPPPPPPPGAADDSTTTPARASAGDSLPIQAVLDQLGPPIAAESNPAPAAEEAEVAAGGVPAAPPAPEPVVRPPLEDSGFWDEVMGVPPGSRAARPTRDAGAPDALDSQAAQEKPIESTMRARLVGLVKRKSRGETTTDAGNAAAEVPAGQRFDRWAVATMVALVAVLAIAAALLGEWTSRPSQEPVQAQEAAAEAPPRALPGYVTASLLNCRTSPTEDAETVRRLARGEPLSVLESTMGWASVNHRGRQCWALARYIAVEQPL